MNKNVKKGVEPRLRFPEFKKAGDWKEEFFSELFQIGSGRDYKHLNAGDIPVYGSGGYMLSVDQFLYDGESACIGRKGTIDRPVFLTGKFWTVDTLFYTHSFKGCLPKFIFYVFQTIEWLKHNEAGGVPSLSKEIINKIKKFVPPKIDEQKKIVDCLSSLDEVITAQGEKVEALKTYKKGLLQQLFPQEGQTTPTLRFPEFKNAGDWEESTVEAVVDTITPPKKLQTADYSTQGKYPIIDQSKDYICGWTDDQTALIKNNLPLIIFGDHTCVLKLAKEPFAQGADGIKILKANVNLDPIFLFQNLQNNPLVMEEYKRHFSSLKEKKVFYPKDKKEQKKIAECLSSLDGLITAKSDELEHLKLHKKGLLQQLFPILIEAVDE